MLKNCFLIFSICCISMASFGQNLQKMRIWQDSLTSLGRQVFSVASESERMESNFLFVKTLVSALKEPNSYFYSFDSLKMISIVSSPDEQFRIFSWNMPLHDGSYLYYGAVQMRSGTLKLTPLLDKTFELKNSNEEITDHSKWYGAQYYEIIPYSTRSYLLLGWKGHDSQCSEKVIEVLKIDPEGKLIFGQNIFSDDPKIVRKIFKYSKSATMLLRYNGDKRRVEFDNLVPLNSGKNQIYIPDLSHNGYILKDGKLVFIDDVEVLNNGGVHESQQSIKGLKSGL